MYSNNMKQQRMPIFLVVLVFFSFSVSGVSGVSGAQSLDTVFPGLSDEMRAALISGQLLANDTTISGDLLYAPEGMGIRRPAGAGKETDNDELESFTVECLSLIPLPDYLVNLSEEELLLHLVNTLRAVSTQEGITYISHRRGNVPYPLFTKSYHVPKVGSWEHLDDPVLQELPSQIHDVVFQKDTSFAGNYYAFNYAIDTDRIFLSVKNMTTLSVFGIIPVIPKQTLNISFAIFVLDEGVLCYSQAHITGQKPTFSFLGFSVHLPSAFQRRITALQEWLSDNLT